MVFRERADPAFRAPDRYTARAGAKGASNDLLRDMLRPPRPAPLPPGRRTPASDLLGQTVLAARTQRICREYGLTPAAAAVGSYLSRSYLARDAGIEVTADAHGVIRTVFLHFDHDDDFAPYYGEIPGGGGADPRRSALRAALGAPGESGDPYHDRDLGDYGPWDRWRRPGFLLHAQYGLDGETVRRITLTLG
jgi:hypothetical protein